MGPQSRLNWSTLIRPRKHEGEPRSDREGDFICEPLDRGTGDEIGRALRHALLHAVPGTAVVAARARLDGKTPPPSWVRELCLNLSQLVLAAVDAPPHLRIEVPAAGTLRAAELVAAGLRIVDPAHELCVVDRPLELELWIESGYGMRYGCKRNPRDLPDGAWPVDAFFAPVRNADYYSEASRVGPWRDLDRLLLHVETNGALSPHEALWSAVRTLSPHSRAA
jgi:DNA-directed RNA polymerase subunit alpha